MKSDQTSYKRATSVSLVGLSLQGVLALVLLLYSLIANDAAALTGSIYLALGLPVWFSLSLVFHQHRLERIEAAEEAMLRSASAAQASVFQESGAELRVAARKLDWMHRALLPAMSLLVGAGLIVFGWLRYVSGLKLVNPDLFPTPLYTGWAVTIGLCIAAIGFIFARFVAGMAKEEVWSNLRAGATWSVGASMVGLLLAIGQGVAFATSDALLRRLPVIIPIIMMALGVEVFLNFVLGVYRPRKPGETPRPAFDSRILGFLAAPDRIAESISEAVNYQFGLDVSSTWFYKLLSRSIAWLIFGGGVAIWALTVIAVVRPEEKALILNGGRLVREVDSGVRWKLPWPFETVEKIPALNLTTVELASPSHATKNGAPILWTEDHGFDEKFLLVRTSGAGSNANSHDEALVSVEIPLQYVVEDLKSYLLLAADSADPADPDKYRRDLLRDIAMREVMEYLSTRTIDDVLGADRDGINRELRRRIVDHFAKLSVDPETGEPRGSGVRIIFVGIVGAHPPYNDKVAASFGGLVSAEQLRQAQTERARAEAIGTLASVAGDADLATRIIAQLDKLERLTEANTDQDQIAAQRLAIEGLIDQAGGQAAGLLLAARADRWVKLMDFRGRAARHRGRLALYRAAPAVYLAGLYLDALRDAVRHSRLFITTFDSPHVTLNFEQANATFENLLDETRAAKEK